MEKDRGEYSWSSYRANASDISDTSGPLEQVTKGLTTQWEDPVIRRHNRRTLTVSCMELQGAAGGLFKEIRGNIDAISLPNGYRLEWG